MQRVTNLINNVKEQIELEVYRSQAIAQVIFDESIQYTFDDIETSRLVLTSWLSSWL